MLEKQYADMAIPAEVKQLLAACSGFCVPRDRATLFRLAMGPEPQGDAFEVAYDVPGRGRVVEALVTRCRNGLSIIPCPSISAASACGLRRPRGRRRATASWACSTYCRRPWPGSGGSSRRADTTTPASPSRRA